MTPNGGNTLARLARILVEARRPAAAGAVSGDLQTEVDTSCFAVPIGQVRVVRRPLLVGESPDRFWARCLATDPFLRPELGVFETWFPAQLPSVVECLRADLAHAGQTLTVEWPAPAQLTEAYRLESACPDCVGQALLFRTADEGWSLHWHRAS